MLRPDRQAGLIPAKQLCFFEPTRVRHQRVNVSEENGLELTMKIQSRMRQGQENIEKFIKSIPFSTSRSGCMSPDGRIRLVSTIVQEILSIG